MKYPNVDLPRPYPIEYGYKLYDYVLEHKPIKIVEFGSSWGFTTIYMAKALKEIGKGTIWTCDNDISRVSQARINFKHYDVDDIINIELFDYNRWLESPTDFDLCYIDIHNDGDKLQKIFDNDFFKKQIKCNKKVLFEGGSENRSDVALSRGMSSFKNIKLNYRLLYGLESDRHVIGEINE